MPTPLPTATQVATLRPAIGRIASLDQFRGYTIAGMLVVNFIGGFAITPILFTHQNTFFSLADTVMPQFFFAVGFAFRLTFGRRAKTEGLGAAYGHIVRRLLGLILITMVLDRMAPRAANWGELVQKGPAEVLRQPLIDGWWGPLTHIAVTSLWILPVIRARASMRVLFMLFSAVIHLAISHWRYFEWGPNGGADGGPIGFLAWTIPTIVGTLACDIATAQGRNTLGKLFAGAAGLMAIGYLLSCGTTLYDVPAEDVEPLRAQVRALDPVFPSAERFTSPALRWAEAPFVPTPGSDQRKHNYWMMSQRAATLSYHTFGAGFALAVYALFYFACDMRGWQVGLFRTFGSNALVAYILHELVGEAVKPFVPGDSPWWWVAAGFAIYFGVTYLMVRSLEKQKIYLKL